ncbi:MAG: endonuclease/exonuclease/phosphatase family protein [Rubricoccaceae bacterium]|nr:endonuclease/exonuclease/phosphatase family protein [Rubricoccaceae bacterium]
MRPSTLRRLAGALILLPLLPLAGCDTGGSGAETTVTVMTRNLYLGGDLFALLAPECKGDAVAGCVAALYFGDVVGSDIPGRLAAVAEEIAANDPDLIGLQEVSLYRTDPSDFIKGVTEPNATTVTFDFLQILLDALDARGLDYVVAATNTNADVEFPATTDGVTFTDVRLTDRDVILARAGLQTDVLFEANFSPLITAVLEVGGVEVPFTRGYSAVEVMKDGVAFTFANVHLEVGGEAAPAQRAQAANLASSAVLGDVEPLIILGDFNADPDPEDTADEEDAYDTLVAAFDDAWAELRTGTSGFTCCQDADLANDTSLLDSRIDLVLYDGNVRPVSIGVVGDDPADRTETGLWPSDHAGVVATLIVED